MKRTLIFSLIGFIAASALTSLNAQSFSQAAQKAQADLKSAEAELARLREAIATEHTPLAKRLEEVEQRAIALREEERASRRLVDHEELDIRSLEQRVQEVEDSNSYLFNLLRDYIRRFETRVHIAELQLYSDIIRHSTAVAEDNSGVSTPERFESQLAVIDASFNRLANAIGGQHFSGHALGSANILLEGEFANIGPISFFRSNDGTVVGEAILERREDGGLRASVYQMEANFHSGIRSLIETGEGEVPLDPTLGNARRLEQVRDDLVTHIKKGGVVMVPILLLFVVAILISLFKWFEIARVRPARESDLRKILSSLRQQNPDQAMAQARKVKGPAGEMLNVAVQNHNEDKEVIEEQLYEVIIKTQPRLERFLPFIAVVAATAPLLGLLGTVTGMIKTFHLITVFGTGDAQQLSSGISEALITTEYGLIVAIPTFIIHALLSRKAKAVVGSMEQTAVGFINGISTIRGDEDVSSDVA